MNKVRMKEGNERYLKCTGRQFNAAPKEFISVNYTLHSPFVEFMRCVDLNSLEGL